jgi:endonuclease-3
VSAKLEQSATKTGAQPVREVIDRLRCRYGVVARGLALDPLDELIATILSQHTSDVNTERAFASLKRRFPTWEQVVDAQVGDVADAIRSGGLADQKAPRIQRVLREVHDRVGAYDLAELRTWPDDTARDWLETLPGVGPKTAACVLLFSLGRDVLPVDTHVHRVALRLGLIAPGTTAEQAHRRLEPLITSGLRHEAHLLLIRHGRTTCLARRPRCHDCVLLDICPTGQAEIAMGMGQA